MCVFFASFICTYQYFHLGKRKQKPSEDDVRVPKEPKLEESKGFT